MIAAENILLTLTHTFYPIIGFWMLHRP